VLVTIAVYFVSHSFSHLIDMAMRMKNMTVVYFTKAIELLFPPMQALNIKDVI
jgi:hypothetical protein